MEHHLPTQLGEFSHKKIVGNPLSLPNYENIFIDVLATYFNFSEFCRKKLKDLKHVPGTYLFASQLFDGQYAI